MSDEAVGPTSSESDARRTFVADIDRRAAELVAADDPDEAAIHIWTAGAGAIEEAGDWAQAIWFIWGSLTDGIDGPRADDAMQRWARDGMRRAAVEWLALDRSDEPSVDAYLGRWLYDECGCARPTP